MPKKKKEKENKEKGYSPITLTNNTDKQRKLIADAFKEDKQIDNKKNIKKEDDGKPKTNRIQEFFSKQEQGMGNELFRVDDKNVDIKTELSATELRMINTLFVNDQFLEECGLEPVFRPYYQKFMRLMISFERKGRGEYVKINTRDKSEETLGLVGNIGSILSGQNVQRMK